jgi:hypothetical protein
VPASSTVRPPIPAGDTGAGATHSWPFTGRVGHWRRIRCHRPFIFERSKMTARSYLLYLRSPVHEALSHCLTKHGLAVPGMPIDSPGMEGGKSQSYDVTLFGPGGWRTYMRFVGERQRTCAKTLETLRENVGFQFLSLRQRILIQNSLSPFKRAKIPINTGLRT